VKHPCRTGLFSVCMTLASVGVVQAQEPSQLAKEILRISVDALPGALFPSLEIVQSRSVRPLSPTTSVPNNVAANLEFSNELKAFDQIPSVSGLSTSGDTFEDAIDVIGGDIEFSSRELTSDEKERLRSAELLLFIGTDKTPSPALVKYRDFERLYQDLVDQYAVETNSAKRANLQTRLAQTERDWQLFGSRDEIKAALIQVDKLSAADNESLQDQWLRLGGDYRHFNATELSALINGAAWLRVSSGSANLGGLKISLAGTSEELDLPVLRRLSFDFGIVQISRPILTSPLLLDHTWRLHSGAVLSDGNSEADSPNEILPRVNSGIILIKNLELFFAEPLSERALDSLSNGSSESIDGVHLVGPGVSAPAYQDQSITVPGPVIVATVVDELKKIPDPDVGREWP